MLFCTVVYISKITKKVNMEPGISGEMVSSGNLYNILVF